MRGVSFVDGQTMIFDIGDGNNLKRGPTINSAAHLDTGSILSFSFGHRNNSSIKCKASYSNLSQNNWCVFILFLCFLSAVKMWSLNSSKWQHMQMQWLVARSWLLVTEIIMTHERNALRGIGEESAGLRAADFNHPSRLLTCVIKSNRTCVCRPVIAAPSF